jgi:hypothetical protein
VEVKSHRRKTLARGTDAIVYYDDP